MTRLLEPPDVGRKASKADPEPKMTVISLKGTVAWRDWLQRASKHCRTDAAKLIDAAVADYVKRQGFTEKPPER